MAEGTTIIIKKKAAHGHGHHGGAWKVAYADFVTAMMAFFMVMWIMGMSQADRDVIQGYFRDPVGFTENSPKAKVNIGPTGGPTRSKGAARAEDAQKESGAQAKADLEDVSKAATTVRQAVQSDPDIEALKKSGALDVTVSSEGIKIRLNENEANSEVFFTLGSAEVRPLAAQVLAKLAPVLENIGRPIVVDGHTDSRPLPGPAYDNFDLSQDRANAVRRRLVASGFSADRILAVRGYADQRPRIAEDASNFANRRVEILIPYKYAVETVTGHAHNPLSEDIEGTFRFPDDPPPSQ